MEQTDVHELTAAYALDALDRSEADRYEEHLRHCSRCQEELASFWDVSSALALAAEGPPPPPELRGRILEQARRERPNVVPLRRRWVVPTLGSAAAVAAAAAVALAVWASSLSNSVDAERTALRAQERALAIVADPAATSVALSGADGRLVVARDRRAAIVVRGLRPAREGRIYELWVAEEGGRPVRAGLFQGSEGVKAVAVERRVPPGAAVMVTEERAGGVEAPTSAPIVRAQAA